MQPTHVVHRAAWRVTGAVCLLGALAGCRDFFYPVAPAVVPVRLALHVEPPAAALAATAPGMAFGGSATQAVTPNPAAAFDKADAVVLRLTAGDKVLVDERKTLAASTADRSVTFDVELPSAGPVNVAVSASLLRGTDTLFTGSTTASLTAGKPTDLTLALTGRATRLEIGGPYTARRLGSAVVLEGSLLLATGDVLSVGAEKTAALRSLDPTVVSVSADRSVTVVGNGTGRIEATLNALRDTAVITVADPCQPPFPIATFTQAVSGTLATTDCFGDVTGSYIDNYSLTLTTPTLLQAVVQGTGILPCVFVRPGTTPTSKLLGAACPGVSRVVQEYQLPAGSYLLDISTLGQKASAATVITGGYTYTLTPITEPQAGCPVSTNGANAFVTWVAPGSSLTGRVTSTDCFTVTGGTGDLYGVFPDAKDTVIATVQAPVGMAVKVLGANMNQQRIIPSGGSVQWAFADDQQIPMTLAIGNDLDQGTPLTGNYTLRLSSGLASTYDACAQPPYKGMVVGTSPLTYYGRLQPRIDCTNTTSVREFYEITAPSLPMRSILTSTMTELSVGVINPENTLGWARGFGTSPLFAEQILAPGRKYRVTAGASLKAVAGNVGSYELALSTVTMPQESCPGLAFADFGGSASARLTASDCPDPYSAGRHYDAYFVLLAPGETVTFSVTGNFPTLLTHWQDTTFLSSRNSTGPGQPLSITYTHPRTATQAKFQQFAVIDWEAGQMGTYTIRVTGTRLTPSALRADGPASAQSATTLPAQVVAPPIRRGSVVPPHLRR